MKWICTFFVEGKPIPKGNHRAFIRGSKAIVTDAQGGNLSDWESSIRTVARKHFNYQPIDNDAVALSIDFIFKHPKNHFTKKGKPTKQFRKNHITRPDADKLTRAVCDALTGVVYKDDSQVMFENISKIYGMNEGVKISIYIGEKAYEQCRTTRKN